MQSDHGLFTINREKCLATELTKVQMILHWIGLTIILAIFLKEKILQKIKKLQH